MRQITRPSAFLKYFKESFQIIVWGFVCTLSIVLVAGLNFGIALIDAGLKSWRTFHVVSSLLTSVCQPAWKNGYIVQRIEAIDYIELLCAGATRIPPSIAPGIQLKTLSKVSAGRLSIDRVGAES